MKKIAFLWNGVWRYGGSWRDGLWRAMKRLEEEFDVKYFEPDDKEGIGRFKPDAIIYWAPFCDQQVPIVKEYPCPKTICFAGGPIDKNNSEGFGIIFVESRINEEELDIISRTENRSYIRAFGINEDIFKPLGLEKKYDGMFAGTFALWKRHHLFAEALGNKGVAIGIKQAHEKECYEVCEKFGVEVHEELPREKIAEFINMSHTVVNTASFWGGGQRLTLEAMACGVPPIVMADSPKNREFVEESGFGVVSDFSPGAIREAIEIAKTQDPQRGIDYINSKWTSRHYAARLKAGINRL